jgi:hypothetical protein
MLPRLLAGGLLIAVAAGLPVVVATGGPASATSACKSEAGPIPALACDDENPPVTGLASGAVDGGTVTVTTTASYTDADTDPIGFECQLQGAGPWGSCTVPSLAAGTYSIAIRAVDIADTALTRCSDPQILCSGAEVPDHDATPATVSVTVNAGGGGTVTPGGPTDPGSGPVNTAPETIITGGPADRLTPSAPVVLSRHPQLFLSSNGPATFNCAINVHKVPCHAGLNTFKKLKPGPQVFVAQAVNASGDFDRTPASLTFYLPINVKAGQGWRTVKSKGAYAGDYVTTKGRGSPLTVAKVRGVRELRVIAPTGPELGVLLVRVGGSKWMKVDLRSATARKLHVFVVRGSGARPLSGAVEVRGRGSGPVAIDAFVAR